MLSYIDIYFAIIYIRHHIDVIFDFVRIWTFTWWSLWETNKEKERVRKFLESKLNTKLNKNSEFRFHCWRIPISCFCVKVSDQRNSNAKNTHKKENNNSLTFLENSNQQLSKKTHTVAEVMLRPSRVGQIGMKCILPQSVSFDSEMSTCLAMFFLFLYVTWLFLAVLASFLSQSNFRV